MGEPLGSATHILAGLFNSITKSCRKICLDTLKMTKQNKFLKESPTSEDVLFGEDLDAVLAGINTLQLNYYNNRSSYSLVSTQPF